MRVRSMAVCALGLVLVVGLAVAVGGGALPLGVPGEWTWSRLGPETWADPLGWTIGATTVALYTAFVGWGYRAISGGGAWRRVGWVSALAGAAVVVQVGLQSAAPEGYGLTKWTFSLHSAGSNGYYTVARSRLMDDPARFVAGYPEWIGTQGSLHVGTHPPGLFLLWRGVLGFWRAHPEGARVAAGAFPASVQAGFREIGRYDPLPWADRAALGSVGLLTLVGCSLTVVPLYHLGRSRLSPAHAWAAAALWPVVPSAILFQPTADTAFPLLATTALALAVRGGRVSAALAGVVLGVAMQMTLAFLAVGLVAAIVLMTRPRVSWLRRAELVGWTGLGFALLTGAFWAASGANPLAIWLANARNHAQFYREFHRSYLAWNLVNPVELAVAIGLPAAAWAIVGFRRAGWTAWGTVAVLALLQLSGRNLSEVARLWLPMMPPLLVAAGAGFAKFEARGVEVALTVGMVAAQTLALQAMIQVVYALA